MIASHHPALPTRWRYGVRGWRDPLVVGLLALVILLPTFIELGQWQWQKGEHKAAQQALHDGRGNEVALSLPAEPLTGDHTAALQYRRLVLTGRFLPERQFLLDNQVFHQRAGFHVFTPFRPDGSEAVLLINRGWLPAGREHHQLPKFATPTATLRLSGVAVLPPNRFFSLAKDGNTPNWRHTDLPVWQTLDLDRFVQHSGMPMHRLILQLDPTAPAGFGRDWPRPDQRIERHFAYALQWFGFAIAALGIWLFFLLRRWRS